ncbi:MULTISPECIES: hypothetical protein [unclassified Streptomyces]|uniref:hypothetical protein n=1 Tax=unclassified Streptomyces TaxID=2593676 RepID=UPI003369ECCB
MSMRIKAGLLSAASFAVSLIAFQTTAQAASYSATLYRGNPMNAYAKATFNTTGDKLTVEDLECDGLSAVGEIQGGGKHWNVEGCNWGKIFTVDLPETGSTMMRACIGEYSTKEIIDCSGWVSVHL